ncbi:MAG: c-type cytochrome [Mariprofundaceae bacterium]
MNKTIIAAISLAAFTLMSQTAFASDDINVEKIFSKKCKMCHSFDKKKMGPAFKDMNKDASILLSTITNGRKSMPKFNKKLSSEEIHAMVGFIQSHQGVNPCSK